MEAYLDNAATTKSFESVKDIMVRTLIEDYGNPSSMHMKGIEAERYITEAKRIIATSMKVEPKELIFTSGGTESNNMALIGTAYANKRAGNHIITTQIEHPSIHNPLIFLEGMGFRITFIPVDSNGIVKVESLLEAIGEDTIIVSIMHVNNEIGSVQDLTAISQLIKKKKADIIFHVDAIQGFGKYRIYPKKIGIDLLSISGHKIHGPKGVGVLYIRDKIKIKPIIYGGEQQKNLRSGTENIPGIAGIGQAVKEIYDDHEEKITRLRGLKKYFVEKVQLLEGATVNGIQNGIEASAPHIISVSFLGVRSEVLLHALEEKEIYVSAGSACASNHPGLSGTLKAIKVKQELLASTIRISLSVNTRIEELDYLLVSLEQLLPKLKLFTRH